MAASGAYPAQDQSASDSTTRAGRRAAKGCDPAGEENANSASGVPATAYAKSFAEKNSQPVTSGGTAKTPASGPTSLSPPASPKGFTSEDVFRPTTRHKGKQCVRLSPRTCGQK